MKIKDILDMIPNHEFIVINQDTPIIELVEIVISHPGIRSIYVKDDNEKIIGEVSLGKLIRNVTIKKQLQCKITTRQLLSCITCNTIKDLMEKRLIAAKETDNADDVLMKAIKHGIKELPILNREGKIIKNIGILDLWAILEKNKIKK